AVLSRSGPRGTGTGGGGCSQPTHRRRRRTPTPTPSHRINGQTVTASTGPRLGDITNPATGVVSGQVALGSKATVESAITAAAEAFPAWRDTSLAKRTS